jgi:hypothetical protein
VYRQRDSFKDILLMLSGLALICTPHLTDGNRNRWKSIVQIPKIRLRFAEKKSLRGEELSRIASSCDQFSGLDFDRPVLEIYETKKSDIKGIFHRDMVVSSN